MDSGGIDAAGALGASADIEGALVAVARQVMDEQQMEGQLLMELLPKAPPANSGHGCGDHVDCYA